ncbi:hypothetical protein C8Q76DRAFT_300150 [Earliella scabrosa]|nr:hypothetical protein C8Q76DRAFT_300150 [Earliella scabrosa]
MCCTVKHVSTCTMAAHLLYLLAGLLRPALRSTTAGRKDCARGLRTKSSSTDDRDTAQVNSTRIARSSPMARPCDVCLCGRDKAQMPCSLPEALRYSKPCWSSAVTGRRLVSVQLQ